MPDQVRRSACLGPVEARRLPLKVVDSGASLVHTVLGDFPTFCNRPSHLLEGFEGCSTAHIRPHSALIVSLSRARSGSSHCLLKSRWPPSQCSSELWRGSAG